jgi:hypothetical protein
VRGGGQGSTYGECGGFETGFGGFEIGFGGIDSGFPGSLFCQTSIVFINFPGSFRVNSLFGDLEAVGRQGGGLALADLASCLVIVFGTYSRHSTVVWGIGGNSM